MKLTFRAAMVAATLFAMTFAKPGAASTMALIESKPPAPNLSELIAYLNGPDISADRPQLAQPNLHRAGRRIQLRAHRDEYGKQLAVKAAELRAKGNFAHLNRAARRREVRALRFTV